MICVCDDTRDMSIFVFCQQCTVQSIHNSHRYYFTNLLLLYNMLPLQNTGYCLTGITYVKLSDFVSIIHAMCCIKQEL